MNPLDAGGMPVQFKSRQLADVFVVAPAGRIDHPNAERLNVALAPVLAAAVAGRNAVVFDFSRVEYISSMGLRVLLLAAKALRAVDARIAVAALSPVASEIFAIARFGHVVEIYPDVPAALNVLSPAAAAAWSSR